MPRKRTIDQEGRFAKGRKSRNQWPGATIWGLGRFAEIALDRWVSRHDCDGTCTGPGGCDMYRRVSRIHAAYGKRKGRN